MKQISDFLLTNNNLAIATVLFIGIVAFIYIIYNAGSYFILKERYHGIRFTTKNIAYITMFTSISVAVTVVISMTAPITVLPPIRVAFEGIMVKITGFMFGPIVGIITGIITEGLTMLFVPSFIHPAYFLTVFAFGFISGIGASFNRISGAKRHLVFLLINIFIIIFGIFIYVIYSYWEPPVLDNGEQGVKIFSFSVSKEAYMYIFLGTLALSLLIIWTVYLILLKKNVNVLNELLPIMLIAVVCEYLSTTLISAWGDGEFLGLNNDYAAMVAVRLVQAPFKIVFNSFILYFSYVAVKPLVKRDR